MLHKTVTSWWPQEQTFFTLSPSYSNNLSCILSKTNYPIIRLIRNNLSIIHSNLVLALEGMIFNVKIVQAGMISDIAFGLVVIIINIIIFINRCIHLHFMILIFTLSIIKFSVMWLRVLRDTDGMSIVIHNST